MKIEGAIKFLEQYTNSEVYTEKCMSAHLLDITALRSMPEAGEPLSLEQLKQMDGKPVWIVEYPDWGTGNCQKTQMIISLTETLIFTE